MVAQADPNARELTARVAEAAGHHAVRLDAVTAPEIVDATVGASALGLLVDLETLDPPVLRAVIEAFTVRRFPASVVALVDGPESAKLATRLGAAVVLERPVHQRELDAAISRVLDPDTTTQPATPEPAEPRPLPVGDGHGFTDILRMGRQL